MPDILNELSALAAAIHYPECWDTAAYPDLLSALREVTASAGCSVCKPQVEQDPVGEGTDDRAIADTVNTLRDIAINFHAADQLRARIAHVVVPRLKRIKNLKARAHDHLALLGAERNRALKAEQERDALRVEIEAHRGRADANGLRSIANAAVNGEMTTSRVCELINIWLAGNFTQDQLPPVRQLPSVPNKAAEDTGPWDVIEHMQDELGRRLLPDSGSDCPLRITQAGSQAPSREREG